MKERAETAGVNLKPEIAKGIPPLYADERMLKQILINLLSNATKFTLVGGKVTIRAWSRPDDGYVFQVSDTGIGIAREDIPKALAQFQQIDSVLNRKYEGARNGLPLTKSRRIAGSTKSGRRRHNGYGALPYRADRVGGGDRL